MTPASPALTNRMVRTALYIFRHHFHCNYMIHVGQSIYTKFGIFIIRSNITIDVGLSVIRVSDRVTSTANMIDVACCLVGLLSSASLFGIYSGTPASIHYGTGGIAGFYSEDQVTVGNLVVQNQVLHFPSCYLPNSLHM
jgi:hypothetical protein